MVDVIAKAWLIKIPKSLGDIAGKKLTHEFLLPGLNEACRVEPVRTVNGLRVLMFHFFHDVEAVSYALVRGDGSATWEYSRKQIYAQSGIEAPQNESATDARFILCAGDEISCAKEGSNFIRQSKTLNHQKSIALDRGVHLLTEPRGFACYSGRASDVNLMLSGAHDLNQFERFVLLFALGMAYREVMLRIIKNMGDTLISLNTQSDDDIQIYNKLSALRESIVVFDAQYYFQLPVHPEKQELFLVVQQFMDVLHVHPLHAEMAHQLGEVSRLTDHKLEVIQAAHRDAMLNHQQQAVVRHEQKMNLLNLMLAGIAIILTTVDLLSHPPGEWSAAIKGWMALW